MVVQKWSQFIRGNNMVCIFIVEDDASLRILYKKALQMNGYDVVLARDGGEAVEMYKNFQEKPEVIIMDYRMPVKNGLEATREITAISNESKIIFASADKTIEQEAMNSGAMSFKAKPFTLEVLVKNIELAMDTEGTF